MTIFLNDELMVFLKAGEGCKDPMAHLCLGMLNLLHESSLIPMLESAPGMESFKDTLDSIRRFCRAICHIFNAGASHTTRPEDVIWFIEYSGPLMFEKSIRNAFKAEGSWWALQASEIMRLASTTIVLKPKLDEVLLLLDRMDGELKSNKSLLPTNSDVADTMGTITEYMKELQKGMRKMDIEHVLKRYQLQVEQMMNTLVALTAEEVENRADLSKSCLEVLLGALNLFAALPGTLSKINEVKSWMTKFHSTLSCNAFKQYVTQDAKGDLDFEHIQGLCGGIPKNAKETDLANQHVPALLRSMLENTLTQASWVCC